MRRRDARKAERHAVGGLEERTFDLVYSGFGAFSPSDITRWARTVAELVAPEGLVDRI